MLKLFNYFLWVLVILVLIIGLDQLMTRVPLKAPGLAQSQVFYVDFRSRLIALFAPAGTGSPAPGADAIETMIEKTQKTDSIAPDRSTRYLYVDRDGTLQFADNLQKVPVQYRQTAQPLAD